MINHIHIKNFALVKKLELDFDSGLSVLTGETGAGKSILLDALGLALGDRADTNVIRVGCDRAEITVIFDISQSTTASNWLLDNELDNNNECIIRRTINRNKPSKAYINGLPSPIQSLKQLGEMLVDLHGQHEHQSLTRKQVQRQLVDGIAGNGELLTQLKESYNLWKTLNVEYQNLSQQTQDRNARLELLRFQVGELNDLALEENELDQLDNEHRRLANSSQLLQSSEKILAYLDLNEASSANSLIDQSISELSKLIELDTSLKPSLEILTSASLQVKDTITELRQYQESTDLDPRRLEWIEQRLAEIHTVSRKHHIPAKQLNALLPQLNTELSNLEDSDIKLGSLKHDIETAASQYLSIAKKLTAARTTAAAKLSTQVTQRMQQLGMEGGQFSILLKTSSEPVFSMNGLEQIEYHVSANAGQPMQLLSKVASGGELSRISLAIQVIAVQNDLIPSLIFDEVDVGIGGRVAEIVGRQLRQLATQRQVICVTHLPQVAALGHHHLQVSKLASDNNTSSQIQTLDKTERIDEIARMLGGIDITEQTLSHAKEMIDNAVNHDRQAEVV